MTQAAAAPTGAPSPAAVPWPAMSVKQAYALITAPGSPGEMEAINEQARAPRREVAADVESCVHPCIPALRRPARRQDRPCWRQQTKSRSDNGLRPGCRSSLMAFD